MLEREERPKADGEFHAEALIAGAHVLFGRGYFADFSMAAAVWVYVPDVDAAYRRALELGAGSVGEPVNQS